MRNKCRISKLPKLEKIQTLSAIIHAALLAALGRSHLNSSIRPNRLRALAKFFFKQSKRGVQW